MTQPIDVLERDLIREVGHWTNHPNRHETSTHLSNGASPVLVRRGSHFDEFQKDSTIHFPSRNHGALNLQGGGSGNYFDSRH